MVRLEVSSSPDQWLPVAFLPAKTPPSQTQPKTQSQSQSQSQSQPKGLKGSSECQWLQHIYQWAQETCCATQTFALDHLPDWLQSQRQYLLTPQKHSAQANFISFLRESLQQTDTRLIMKIYSSDYDLDYFFCFEKSAASGHWFLLSDGIGEYASYMIPGKIDDIPGFINRMEQRYTEAVRSNTDVLEVTVTFWKCEFNKKTDTTTPIDEPD